VKKIVLVFLLFGGLAMAEPRSRERVIQLSSPVSDALRTRSARRALKTIAADVEKSAEEGKYPQPGSFPAWLQVAQHKAEDPWGSYYYIELGPESFTVGSPGPDARRATDDDLRWTGRLTPQQQAARTEPGVLVVDHQPAPPPSSAGRSARTKASEAAQRQ
jgi:hypothetical protein